MWIKNTNESPVELVLGTRTIRLDPGDETAVAPEEVRDASMREHLQVRTVVIVRPTTAEEEETLMAELGNG